MYASQFAATERRAACPRARPAMKNEYFIAGARWTLGIHTAQRMVSCAGDTFAHMLVGLADVDEGRTSAHEFGGAFRGNCLQICHDGSPFSALVGPSRAVDIFEQREESCRVRIGDAVEHRLRFPTGDDQAIFTHFGEVLGER